jgi:hypothetical protein
MPLDNNPAEQRFLFAFGLLLFLSASFFGWEKLHFGFNFIDEGFHMTDGWRLAAGDHFLDDGLIRNNLLYTFFNGLIFRLFPDITLLEFRKLAYIAAILALLLISMALYAAEKQIWFQPYIFSFFAFSGFDPVGMFTNLNYYAYPHLFLTLYASFFIFGIYQNSPVTRRLQFAASGFSLWGISFSVLHLSPVIFSPLLFFLLLKRLKTNAINFTVSDLMWVVWPFILCWLIFIAVFQKAYLISVWTAVQASFSGEGYAPTELITVNWDVLAYIAVMLVFWIVSIGMICKLNRSACILSFIGVSILMFFLVDTSFFSMMKPYYHGWFGRPMCFAALIISFLIGFWIHLIRKAVFRKKINQGETVAILLVVPSTIMIIFSTIFSGMGALTALHASIPISAAMTMVILYQLSIKRFSNMIKMTVIILFFFPFYVTSAWADWKFTYFDVFPAGANVTIDKGFGKGIKTNTIYLSLYEWIKKSAETYSNKNDFIISYTVSPMTYMIAKRRPALDHSWTSLTSKPWWLYAQSISKMKAKGRDPKLAFVFESMPAFYPISLNKPHYIWFQKEFRFPANDAISKYLLTNMKFVEEHVIYEDVTVKLFKQNQSPILDNAGSR